MDKTVVVPVEKLADLLQWATSQVCQHDETHRGGVLWEICDHCGAKWADDEGGKPEFKWPVIVDEMYSLISAAPAATAHPPSIGEITASYIATQLHYPEHWDTAAYPTVADALIEVIAHFQCTSEEYAPVSANLCLAQQDERELFEHFINTQTKQSTLKDANGFYEDPLTYDWWKVWQARAALTAPQDAQERDKVNLQDIEQYRMQMAGISTAAFGYWKPEDGIHPDYDTVALRDVAALYAKYDALFKAAQPAQPEGKAEQEDAVTQMLVQHFKAEQQAEPVGINFDVLRRSYGFTLDDDGEVHGLVAGDMGYEPTGIKLCAETMKVINGTPTQPQLSDATAEQQARDMLERMGVPDSQEYTAGDLVELANLISRAAQGKDKPCGS